MKARSSHRAAAAPPTHPSRLVAPIALFGAAASLVVFVVTARRLNLFVVDDVFISLRYGRHLLSGVGLVYNAGERVEGYTNFLWTILASPATFVPIGVMPYLRLLNGAFAVLAAWQAGVLLEQVAARSMARFPSVAPEPPFSWRALGFAAFLMTPMVWISAAEGLETMLFTALLLLVANRVIADRDHSALPPAGLALAALSLTRPDGMEFIAWAVVAALLLGRPRPYIARMALLATLLVTAYWIARWTWYGQFLPNTFYAKRGGIPELFWRGAGELRRFAWLSGGPALLIMIPALFARGRRLVWTMILVVALRVAFQLWSGGAQLARYRFLVPTTPFLQTLAVAGAISAAKRYTTRIGMGVLTCALLLMPAWFAFPAAEADARSYGAGLWNAHRRLGEDAEAHTSEQAILACPDAGLVPLLSDRTNIDITGLNDRHMAHLSGRFLERIDVGYLLGRHPDLVVLLSRVEQPRSAADFWLAPDAALFDDARFQAAFSRSRSYRFNLGYFLLVYRRKDSLAAPAEFWTPANAASPTK